MAWKAQDIPDLTGKTALITGANSGLGFESTKALAAKGAHVIMAARSREKAEAARAKVLAELPQASLELLDMDLGSLESVRAAADAVIANRDTLDVLMNNAGLMATPYGQTEDGFETQFGVNHLGHWVLTARLLPLVIAAEGRVVTVTSTAHHFGRRVDPSDINLEQNYQAWSAYGRAKLANYHFGIGLQKELEARGLAAQSLIAHPGLSHTNLQIATAEMGGGGSSAEFFKRMAANRGLPQDRGAESQLRAATDPRAKGGEFYGPAWGNTGNAVRKPIMRPGRAKSIEILWQVSEELTGEALRFEQPATQASDR